MILSRNRIEEEKIVHYHVGQAFFHQVNPGLEVFLCFAAVVGGFLTSGGGLPEEIELL